MTCQQVLAELKGYSNKQIENIFDNHGAKGQSWGVKVQDLKKVQKKIKKDYPLSLELFDTGISDAQYLAGLIADEKKMTKKDLQHWADSATWHMIGEYTVPWIAAESAYGWELGQKWIDAKDEHIQASGWTTLASLVSIVPDDDLDVQALKKLLQRVEKTIAAAGNRVRYVMNGFVIAVGCYVAPLTEAAKKTGISIGKVTVDMGGTACKVPYAPEYIQKAEDRGTPGKKKKMARC